LSAPVVAGSGAEAGAGGGLDRSSSSASVELIERPGGGVVEVRGALVFATARRARQEGLRVLSAANGAEVTIDCSGVTASDSAGLTVLLDWLSGARRAGKKLTLSNLPAPIVAIAKISNVEEWLVSG